MSGSSTTFGYLRPTTTLPAPVEDDALADQLQAMIVGVTGLVGSLVRPRWQIKPPPQPSISTDWCAIGIMEYTPDDNGAVVFVADGRADVQRHAQLRILTSFYGPNGGGYAAILRDGLTLHQNMDVLLSQGFGIVDVGVMRSVPELISEQWFPRVDMELLFNRQTTRTYAVRTIVAADGSFRVDSPLIDQPWNVEQ